jgi:hypothetical protein
MRQIFWGFCRNWCLMSPLHYLSSSFDFGFELAEIFVFEKPLPAITDTGSRRLHVSVITASRQLPASLIRGVGDSPHHRYGESAIEFFEKKTLRIDDTESCRLPVLLSRIVIDSSYHRCGESTTPRIVESGSRGLCGSVIWGVAIQRKN